VEKSRGSRKDPGGQRKTERSNEKEIRKEGCVRPPKDKTENNLSKNNSRFKSQLQRRKKEKTSETCAETGEGNWAIPQEENQFLYVQIEKCLARGKNRGTPTSFKKTSKYTSRLTSAKEKMPETFVKKFG